MIFLASLYKQYIYHKRYVVNTIFSMVLFMIVFVALMFGYSSLSSTPLEYGTDISGLIVSYYAWMLMMSVYTSTGYVVEQNKTTGTMENIIVNSQHITRVLIYECLANILIHFLFSWIVIGMLSMITSVRLYIHVVTVMVILMVGLISVLGVSLMVAGVGLIFQKMGSVMSLLQFALLGGLFLPESIISNILVPFYSANSLLKRTFIEDVTLLNFSVNEYLMLLINSFAFLAMGVSCFKLGVKYAKRRGTLAYY